MADRFGQGGPVGVARYETFLRRLFSVKGTVAPEIESKLQAGISIDAPVPEFAWLKGEMLAFGTVQRAAVAGQFSLVSWFPAVTGQLYVIPKLFLYASAGASARVRIDARLAGTVVGSSTGVRDNRWVPSLPSLAAYTATNAANQITQEYFTVPLAATTRVELAMPFVLLGGGQSLNIELDTANVTLLCGVEYFERASEPSEA